MPRTSMKIMALMQRGRHTSLLVFLFAMVIAIFMITNSLLRVYCASSTKVLIYGYGHHYLTKFYSDYFCQRFGEGSVQLRYLNTTQWREEFLNVTKVMISLGVQAYVKNPSSCYPCQQGEYMLAVDDVLLTYASPMVFVFNESRLVVILFDGVDLKALAESLQAHGEGTLNILTHDGQYVRNDPELRESLEKLAFGGNEIGVRLSDAMIPVISLAFVDSINPCTFLIFTGLLLMVHKTMGKRGRTLETGLLFSSAVFVGYYLLGVGLASFFRYATFMKIVVIALGFMMSFTSIFITLRGEDRCPMPGPIKRLLVGRLFARSYYNLGAAFALGILSSITLLPCSSGPYFVGLTFMQALRDAGDRYLLLAFYNLVFIAPLVAISFMVFFTENTFDRINGFKKKGLNVVELISGVVLGIVSAYLLWELLTGM